MATGSGVSADTYPTQGLFFGCRVEIMFRNDRAQRVFRGTVVRSDEYTEIIRLDDGRYIFSDECYRNDLNEPSARPFPIVTKAHLEELKRLEFLEASATPTDSVSSTASAVSEFHKQRRMFWLSPSGEIKLAGRGDRRSHAEWLLDEFGITEPQLRGYVDDTGVYYYSTDDYQAQPGDLGRLRHDLGRIFLILDLEGDLPVYSGVIPGEMGQRWKGRDRVGVVLDFVR
jgi:hypothetical protein